MEYEVGDKNELWIEVLGKQYVKKEIKIMKDATTRSQHPKTRRIDHDIPMEKNIVISLQRKGTLDIWIFGDVFMNV